MAGEGDIFSGTAGGAAAGASVGGPWGALIGGGLGLAGGIFSYLGKQEQVAAMKRQQEEELRRRTMADAQKFGEATAAAAASGFELDSTSLQSYLGEMHAEMKRQQDFQRRAGAANATNFSTAAGVGLFTDLGGTLGSIARQANYWKEEG